MRHHGALVEKLAFAALIVLGCVLWAAARRPDGSVRRGAVPSEWLRPGEIVVDLSDTQAPAQVERLARRLGLVIEALDPVANPHRILRASTASGRLSAMVAALRSEPAVERVEPQLVYRALWIPNDPRYGEQWNFRRIQVERAWDQTRGANAVVAVIDTGVALDYDGATHPCKDFRGVAPRAPYDFVNGTKAPYDDNGHGTHVAGTIAEATNNGEGVAGIAPDARLMPLKVLGPDGSGRMSDVARAIRYAADHGAHVINMSLGAPFPDSVTHSACQYARDKGVTIVCAAGNSGGRGVGYPAAYPECIAVSAVGLAGQLAPYSSWGPEIALCAPGGDKRQHDRDGILQNTLCASPGSASLSDAYCFFQGTSMAAPHVAAVAALIVSSGVRDPERVRATLARSSTPRGSPVKYGRGELNAAAAVSQAARYASAPALRLGLTCLVALLAAAITLRRGRGPSPNLAAALGFALMGAVLPDAVGLVAGPSTGWSLLASSILIPAYLLLFESDGPLERRVFAMLALGLASRLALDLWLGTAPLVSARPGWEALWLAANVVLGARVVAIGLRERHQGQSTPRPG